MSEWTTGGQSEMYVNFIHLLNTCTKKALQGWMYTYMYICIKDGLHKKLIRFFIFFFCGPSWTELQLKMQMS